MDNQEQQIVRDRKGFTRVQRPEGRTGYSGSFEQISEGTRDRTFDGVQRLGIREMIGMLRCGHTVTFSCESADIGKVIMCEECGLTRWVLPGA